MQIQSKSVNSIITSEEEMKGNFKDANVSTLFGRIVC